MALLRDTSKALAGEHDLNVMLQRCVQALVDRLEAAFARVWTLDADGRALTLRASAGLYTHLDGGHGRIALGEYKIGRIARDRVPHLTNDVAEDPEISDPAWARRERMTAFAGYPLVVGDSLVGVLGLFARHRLSETTLEILETVADALALGIRRASVEQTLRAEGEVSEILYQAGTAVGRVHRREAVAQTVTDLATEATGARFGAFLYNVTDERGEAYTLYALAGASREAFAGFPLPRNTAIFEPTFRGQGVERLDDVARDPRFGRNPPFFGMPTGHPPLRSYLAVPVISRSGAVLGGLFFGHPEPGIFDERAERLAVGVAGHAAAALDAVRLFEIEHRLALNFQRTLLGSAAPRIDGVRFVQHYVPASDLAAVGGDWYDTAALGDGRVSLTIGDVAGHDLGAAIAMGRIRNALQLYTLEGHGPAAALDLTERYMQRAGIAETATAIHAIYDPPAHSLLVSRAGHLPPVVALPDGRVRALPISEIPGPMLGIGPFAARPREDRTIQLEPGIVILLYTDGLVEQPGSDIEARIDELCGAVARALSHQAPFSDSIIDQMVGGFPRDDVALLAMFVDPA